MPHILRFLYVFHCFQKESPLRRQILRVGAFISLFRLSHLVHLSLLHDGYRCSTSDLGGIFAVDSEKLTRRYSVQKGDGEENGR